MIYYFENTRTFLSMHIDVVVMSHDLLLIISLQYWISLEVCARVALYCGSLLNPEGVIKWIALID